MIRLRNIRILLHRGKFCTKDEDNELKIIHVALTKNCF